MAIVFAMAVFVYREKARPLRENEMKREGLEEKKKKLYGLFCDRNYVPMKIKELAMLLDIPRERREELREVLDALVADGKIEVNKRGKYRKASPKLLEGEYTANARGFGFVTVEGEDEDFFVPAKYTGNAFHGDRVKIVPLTAAGGQRPEARVVDIVCRANTEIVGMYRKSRHYGFVIPDNVRFTQDIFIPEGCDLGAVNGHKVVCHITDYGDEKRRPEGEITEILGHANDPGVDILSVVKAFELPTEFPAEVLAAASEAGMSVGQEEIAGRMDLRCETMVTIDGEDAKDLDDAISLRCEGEDYILGVHIADVTHYVREGSPLDVEALKRGTSVYLVDRVIPMLPHALSNGICSLNQGEDRLALSCIMTLNSAGEVTDYQIAETVIRVDRRMSYTSVKKILEDHDPEETEKYRNLVPMFEMMRELSALIRKRRAARGSLDFDFPETKIHLDEKGRPVEILPYERNVATDMIEDFMLTANETVAQHFYWQEIPFIYRTHGTPSGDKIRQLASLIGSFGLTLKGNAAEIHPKELQKLLGKIAGAPQEAFISRLVLRPMQQAKYTTECSGHFGLAAEYYCHFTSPIRRYPDLQIHRIIKESLHNRLDESRREHYGALLPDVAAKCSKLERRADDAEREVEKLKKVQYMERHIGEEYEGMISGVTGWGMYMELPNTVEGLVHVSTLRGDYYVFSESTYELIGERTNRHFRLGEKVRIRVEAADTLTRTIDFLLVEDRDEDR